MVKNKGGSNRQRRGGWKLEHDETLPTRSASAANRSREQLLSTAIFESDSGNYTIAVYTVR